MAPIPWNGWGDFWIAQTTGQTLLFSGGWQAVQFNGTAGAGTRLSDPGFTWVGASDYSVRVLRAGRVWIDYTGSAQHRSGTRGNAEFKLRRKVSGGSFADLPGTNRRAYFRDTTAASAATLGVMPLDVAENDEIQLLARCEFLNPGGADTVPHGTTLTVSYTPGPGGG